VFEEPKDPVLVADGVAVPRRLSLVDVAYEYEEYVYEEDEPPRLPPS
jgi:hypothetical protein